MIESMWKPSEQREVACITHSGVSGRLPGRSGIQAVQLSRGVGREASPAEGPECAKGQERAQGRFCLGN